MVASRTGGLTPVAPFARSAAARTPAESTEDPHVANIASQIKRNRQNEKRRLRNKSVRAELRTRTKNAVTAATSGAEDSVEQLRLAVKRIDKAAARGVIHKNTAANHKSRLVRRVAAIEAAAAAANEPADEVDEEVDA
jgi:small subunit ribosomal protein S20